MVMVLVLVVILVLILVPILVPVLVTILMLVRASQFCDSPLTSVRDIDTSSDNYDSEVTEDFILLVECCNE